MTERNDREYDLLDELVDENHSHGGHGVSGFI